MKVCNCSGLFGGHLAMGLNCALFKSCEEKMITYYTVLVTITTKMFTTIITSLDPMLS
jgi:hypothetical protein